MKILLLDIETSPNVADVWGLFNQNISLTQLRETSRVICFGAKWHGKHGVIFSSEFADTHQGMVELAWKLLDEADVVVHYNGARFDIPNLNREFVLAGLPPPSPYKQVDLLRTVRKQFRFTSNKLDHVAQQLGLGSKVKHAGHGLWSRVLAGDEKAWREMRKYNVQDVRLTEQLYDRLLPWLTDHPARTLYEVGGACPRCGGVELERRGFAYTAISKFQRFRCKGCGTWSRAGKAEDRIDVR